MGLEEVNMGYDLFNQRDDLSRELFESIKLMEQYGTDYARKDSAYQIELYETATRLKAQGETATMISLTIKGNGKVPKVRLDRDIAEVMYKTAQEKINAIKLQLKLVEAQIEREWSQAKRV